MINLRIRTRPGGEHELTVLEGQSLMEVLRQNGADEPFAVCGGCCSCATCHVYVDDVTLQKLDPPSEDEDLLLDSTLHRRANSRLSCQLRIGPPLDGAEIEIAPED